MPLEYVGPEVFVEHGGVTVYHLYKNDFVDQGRRGYWFATCENGSDNAPHGGPHGEFDVRSLSTTVTSCDTDARVMEAVLAAIDQGVLVAACPTCGGD